MPNPLMPGESPRSATRQAPAGECRCACGSLLARLVEGGVELKCRRCKRTLLLPLGAGALPEPGRGARALPLEAAG
jgi:hypothetical protein